MSDCLWGASQVGQRRCPSTALGTTKDDNQLVIDTGNPWVILTLSVPVSTYTHIQEAWVWVQMGFSLGTGMGRIWVRIS